MKSLFHTLNKTAILLVWLFISILIGQGSLPNMVLCIGADGHVEVEAADGGRCTSFLTRTKQNTSPDLLAYKATPTQDHCGQCVDLPILTSPAHTEFILPSPEIKPNARLIVVSSVYQAVSPAIAIQNLLPDFPPRINPTLISLRTVTLLI